MQLKALLTDDDAVSPVIGVILMVAITVILAAVIASFVLGIGDEQEVQPTAQFDFDYDSSEGNVSVTHTSGDAVPNSAVVIRGSNWDTSTSIGYTTTSRDWSNGSYDSRYDGGLSGELDGEDAVVSGDSATIPVNGDNWEVRVVWESSGGGSTATLASESGPGA